jgi:hypothetical protein
VYGSMLTVNLASPPPGAPHQHFLVRGACPCCPWEAMALGPGDQQGAYRPCRSMWARGAWCGDALVPAALPRGFLSSRVVSCYRSRFTRAIGFKRTVPLGSG